MKKIILCISLIPCLAWGNTYHPGVTNAEEVYCQAIDKATQLAVNSTTVLRMQIIRYPDKKYWDGSAFTSTTQVELNPTTHLAIVPSTGVQNGRWADTVGTAFAITFDPANSVSFVVSCYSSDSTLVEYNTRWEFDTVWDETLSNHRTTGTTGKKMGDLR